MIASSAGEDYTVQMNIDLAAEEFDDFDFSTAAGVSLPESSTDDRYDVTFMLGLHEDFDFRGTFDMNEDNSPSFIEGKGHSHLEFNNLMDW